MHVLFISSSNSNPNSISIFTFLFITSWFFLIPISYTQGEGTLLQCFERFECGNVKNLVFPFWKNDSHQLCQQEGFELSGCEVEDQSPIIHIGENEFRLIYVNVTSYTMTIAIDDLWDQICDPPSNRINNVNLGGYSFLQFSPANRYLTFFYNCDSSSQVPRPSADFGCSTRSFYADDIVDRGSLERFRRSCGGGGIQVQVNRSGYEQLRREWEQPSFEPRSNWRLGFDVVYNFPGIFCDRCNNRSDGSCDDLDSSQYRSTYQACRIPAKATEILAGDSHFEACMPRSCGTGPVISYPFWISEEQDSFCGYPNFEITCKEKEPILKISEETYIIKDISYNSNSLLVVNSVVHEDDCPTPRRNVSLDRTPFSLSPDNVNLSFLYNCEEQPNYHTYPVSCASNASSQSFAVFHKEGLENTNYSIKSCRTLIDAPVYVNDDVSFSSLLEMNYTKILKLGFVLDWTAHSCSSCNRSGGRCGFSYTNEFVCFCSDGPHSKTCNDGNSFNLKTKLIVGFCAATGGILITCLAFYCWRQRRRGEGFFKSSFLTSKRSLDSSLVIDSEKGDDSFPSIHVFTYKELEEATNNFDSDKELGDGGFGTVYYGKLRDGRTVAIKRLYENNFRRVEQFMNEVDILTRLRHKNLVSLYGCTSRHSRELLLVYEYVANGTVADHLHGELAKPGALPWHIRLEIAVETADALRYLHASTTIHRDVKTTNILLDKDFHVKVADFGLSRLFPLDVTHVSTAPQGTPGYVDPEYHQCYQLTSKSDVFSFGVVLIELISSKPAVDIMRHRHEINLWNMAINKIQNRALHELVDLSLGFESNDKVRKTITGVAEVAYQCLQNEKDMRPTMEQVLEALMGIQDENYKKEKAEETDMFRAKDQEGELSKSGALPRSPDSVMIKWASNGSSCTATTPSF